MEKTFRVRVAKEYLKFSAAHFIAHPGFRERLHGHNYQVSIEVVGDLGPDGYVLDFGKVKRIARELCNRLDERTLIPAASECLEVEESVERVTVRHGNDEFRFPASDVVLLPIRHSSVEELSQYLACQLGRTLLAEEAVRIRSVEVGIEETSGQTAYCRYDLP